MYGKTEAEHLQHLRAALAVLRKNRLYARLSKCDFFKPEVLFLGHGADKDGLHVDLAKVAAVREWVALSNVKKLRSFRESSLANYFCKFMQGSSSMVAPMTRLTR